MTPTVDKVMCDWCRQYQPHKEYIHSCYCAREMDGENTTECKCPIHRGGKGAEMKRHKTRLLSQDEIKEAKARAKHTQMLKDVQKMDGGIPEPPDLPAQERDDLDDKVKEVVQVGVLDSTKSTTYVFSLKIWYGEDSDHGYINKSDAIEHSLDNMGFELNNIQWMETSSIYIWKRNCLGY